MAKSKLIAEMQSFGLYERWDGDQKSVPTLKAFTTEVPARVGIEFGFVLHIKHGRGERLTFCIDHPGWIRDDGRIEPPFEGDFHIRTNDFSFFLGDTIWEPWKNKIGNWVLTAWHNDKVIGNKTFHIIHPKESRL